MKEIFRWIRKDQDPGMEEVEDLLNKVFQPVVPRPEFVRGISQRLVKPSPSIPILSEYRSSWGNAFWIIVGVLSGFILVIMGIHGIIRILESWLRPKQTTSAKFILH